MYTIRECATPNLSDNWSLLPTAQLAAHRRRYLELRNGSPDRATRNYARVALDGIVAELSRRHGRRSEVAV